MGKFIKVRKDEYEQMEQEITHLKSAVLSFKEVLSRAADSENGIVINRDIVLLSRERLEELQDEIKRLTKERDYYKNKTEQ